MAIANMKNEIVRKNQLEKELHKAK